MIAPGDRTEGAARTGSGFSRRTLIRGASAVVAVAAVGTSSARAGATVDPTEWTRLRSQLRGALVLPQDREYRTTKALVDHRFDDNAPLGVVEVAEPQDVQVAVAFARDHGLPIAARAGGHSFVGASAATDALVIDVRGLDHITVEADQVTAGAGVNSLAALTELDKSGLALPVGVCSGVGLAGLTLGGGLGFDGRRYGMTCDRLVAAELVLPNGDTKKVDAASAPDLFWALRGAGGATGIVTSLTYRHIPAVSKDVVRLSFPGDRAAHVLTGWAQWMASADRAVWARVNVEAAADGPRCDVLIVCPAGAGTGAAGDLIAAASTPPTATDHRTLEHLDAVHDVNFDKPRPGSTRVAGSDVLRQLSPAAADAIVEVIAARSRSGAPGLVMVEPIDGAIKDTALDASAFPWRAHSVALEWAVTAPSTVDEAYRWVAAANQAVATESAGGYVNLVEPTDTVERCFAHNFPRLQVLRQAVDPDRRLRWGINR